MSDGAIPLLTGRARFVADLDVAGLLHLAYVRATDASARIVAIDVEAAREAPGVVAVLTAADLDVLPVWEIEMIPEPFAQPPLAHGTIRYAGERIAAVVADAPAAAVDAAELVTVVTEPQPAVVDPRRSEDVALAWPAEGTAPPPASRAVPLTIVNPRLAVTPLEGHAVLAVPDPDGGLTVHVSTQVPNPTRVQLARSLRLDPAQLRVVVPHVGGGFGGKAAGGNVDHLVVAAAALRLGRPVRYVEDRTANLTGMHGRGSVHDVVLHSDGDGRLLGLRADIVCDAGAYPSVGAVEPGKTRLLAAGGYDLPHVDVAARSVTTNLVGTGAYRGPGRAEASLALERALDVLALDLGVDPIDLRRRNLVRRFPHRAATGIHLDSGDYDGLLDALVEHGGYDDLRAEQRARRASPTGCALGIGVALVVDSTAWFARRHGASVTVLPTGRVRVVTGTASAGQRHDRFLRTLVQEVLPVAEADVEVVEGDTREWDWGDGTMGSRSTQLAGTAARQAAAEVGEELRRRAAARLEAALDDVVALGERGFGVRGVPTSALPLAELVDEESPVGSSCVFDQPDATYPSAAHLSVVEVDLDTGLVRPRRHVTVTDAGRIVDEAGARGQVVGATAQGISQALGEEVVVGPDGTVRTATLLDYGVLGAPDLPPVEVHFRCTPTDRNPLGAKGIGEIGMLAAPAAVANAVVDALSPFGVRHVDLPATPARVWAALATQAR